MSKEVKRQDAVPRLQVGEKYLYAGPPGTNPHSTRSIRHTSHPSAPRSRRTECHRRSRRSRSAVALPSIPFFSAGTMPNHVYIDVLGYCYLHNHLKICPSTYPSYEWVIRFASVCTYGRTISIGKCVRLFLHPIAPRALSVSR